MKTIKNREQSRFFLYFISLKAASASALLIAPNWIFPILPLTVNQVFCWNTTNLVGLEGSCLRII